jgi:hypothetical protein
MQHSITLLLSQIALTKPGGVFWVIVLLVKEKQPKSAQDMWELLQDCWKSIPDEAG